MEEVLREMFKKKFTVKISFFKFNKLKKQDNLLNNP